MDPAHENDPRTSAHNELEAILRDADAARRRTGEDEPKDERLEPRPRLNVVEGRNGRTETPSGRTETPGGPPRGGPQRGDVRFEGFDVRVDAPGEMKIKAYRLSGRSVLALVLGAVVAYQWLTSPNGAGFLKPQPLPDSYTEASARWTLVLTAQRLEQFRAEHQRLPDDLSELGPAPADLVTYERLSDTEFRLQAPGRNSPLSLGPTTNRELFLSNGLDVLRMGPDKAP